MIRWLLPPLTNTLKTDSLRRHRTACSPFAWRRAVAAFALFALPGMAQQKDSIVVTGQYEPVATEESERPVTSVEIRGTPRLVSNSILDFLDRDASVDIRQRGQNNIQADVSIRGGSFGQTLILLDGIRLNDVQSGHLNMDLPVPLESLERVEVLKGSGSTLYGSDAVGGVVNLITHSPEVSEFLLRTAFGSFGTSQQSATVSLVRSWWSEQLSASRDFSTGFTPDRDYRNLSLFSASHLRSNLGETAVFLGLSDKPYGADQFYGNYNSWERTKTWYAAIRQPLGSRTSLSLAYRRHSDLFVLLRYQPQIYTNRHITEGWQGAARRWEQLAKNVKLHYGVEVIHDSIDSNNLGLHERTRGAGYVALDVRALKRYSFTAGIRDEVYGNNQHQVSPSAAVGAWLNSKLKLRGGVSQAFRLPSYTDLYYHDPANLGSPNLRPEHATSYEGGLDARISNRIRADVTVFQRREKDVIDYVRASVNDIWRATNFQRLNFTGVEASSNIRLREGQVLDFSYTALHGVEDSAQAQFSKYSFNYPNHLGVAGWQGKLPWGLVGRARIGAVQRFGSDPYAVLDLYAARARGRWRPFVHATNLTGTVYQEIYGVAMPGRAFLGGVEVRVK